MKKIDVEKLDNLVEEIMEGLVVEIDLEDLEDLLFQFECYHGNDDIDFIINYQYKTNSWFVGLDW